MQDEGIKNKKLIEGVMGVEMKDEIKSKLDRKAS